ncbi:MAG TPA: CBS domain-containing protein [Candidatus Eisenbacteria bacterium]|jgi:CBS domain-containing protein|nr:CBS domain-containing protein [Candidatus Eisenbacteria bacterium]
MRTKVADIMTREVETVQSVATLREAAEKMRDRNVGSLPVYVGDVLTGMVTDRDITVKATAEGVSPSAGKVEDVMTWCMEWCREDDDVEAVAHVMETKSVRRLAVLDPGGELVGIVTLSDLATGPRDSALVEQVVEATRTPSRARPLEP